MSDSRDGAAAFEEDYVAPESVHAAQALACADDSESCFCVKTDAGDVFGKYSGLERPDAGEFGFSDEAREQRRADTRAARGLSNVDADFGDACIDAAAGHRRERGPAENFAVFGRDKAAAWNVAAIPLSPFGSRLLEGGVAGGDSFEIDGPHRVPVGLGERGNRDHGEIILGVVRHSELQF